MGFGLNRTLYVRLDYLSLLFPCEIRHSRFTDLVRTFLRFSTASVYPVGVHRGEKGVSKYRLRRQRGGISDEYGNGYPTDCLSLFVLAWHIMLTDNVRAAVSYLNIMSVAAQCLALYWQ